MALSMIVVFIDGTRCALSVVPGWEQLVVALSTHELAIPVVSAGVAAWDGFLTHDTSVVAGIHELSVTADLGACHVRLVLDVVVRTLLHTVLGVLRQVESW